MVVPRRSFAAAFRVEVWLPHSGVMYYTSTWLSDYMNRIKTNCFTS